MKNVHIGNVVNMADTKPLAEAIATVLRACADTHADREVSLKALAILEGSSAVASINFDNCLFRGGLPAVEIGDTKDTADKDAADEG